jgi:hypothetical protein
MSRQTFTCRNARGYNEQPPVNTRTKLSKTFKKQVIKISCRVCDTRRADIKKLTAGGVTSYKDLVKTALNQESDIQIRRIGAWVLGRLPARKSGLNALMQLLVDPDTDVAAKAANSAGKLKHKKSVPLLIEMLNREDKKAFAAIESLGLIKGKDAAEALLHLMKTAEPVRCIEAAKQLTSFKSKKITNELIEILTHSQIYVQVAAAHALGFKGDKVAIEPLLNLARDTTHPDEVRSQALESLGYLAGGQPSIAEKIEPFLRSKSIELRFWAAFSLSTVATRKQKSAIKKLELLAESDHTLLCGWWTVAEEARYALDCIRGIEPAEPDFEEHLFSEEQTELLLGTGDKIRRSNGFEILELATGDTLTTAPKQKPEFHSTAKYKTHHNQPGNTTVISYQNGDNIAFTQTGVVQLIRAGKNLRIKRT